MEKKMFKVLVVDQFGALSPAWLQRHAMTFEALCEAALDPQNAGVVAVHREPMVLEVDESYLPPMATTTFRAAEDGGAEVWKYRWDSSG